MNLEMKCVVTFNEEIIIFAPTHTYLFLSTKKLDYCINIQQRKQYKYDKFKYWFKRQDCNL